MKRLTVGFLTLLMMAGLAIAAGSPAQAAQVQETSRYTIIWFTHAETVQISRSGVSSIADHPAVRPHRYVSPDYQSRDGQRYRLRDGTIVVYTTAQRMVNEAAAKPNGRLIVTINKKSARPMTIWTRW